MIIATFNVENLFERPRAMNFPTWSMGQGAIDAEFEGFGQRLQERLRGEDVLDLARADAEGQCTKSAVRGGVAIAADDRHARLRVAEFWADDMDDALMHVVNVVKTNAEFFAVLAERFDLLPRNGVGDGE